MGAALLGDLDGFDLHDFASSSANRISRIASPITLNPLTSNTRLKIHDGGQVDGRSCVQVLFAAYSPEFKLALPVIASPIQCVVVFDGGLDKPSCPVPVVNGKNDLQSPIADLYILLEYGMPKAARFFPGGHMGQTPQRFPTIVGWLKNELS